MNVTPEFSFISKEPIDLLMFISRVVILTIIYSLNTLILRIEMMQFISIQKKM